MEQNFRLILASQSPRRRELLARMGYVFETCAPEVDEQIPGHAREVVKMLAERKARWAAERYESGVVIASDTLVSLDGRALGKPTDPAEARAMLRALSGREHEVFTGICLLSAETGAILLDVVRTGVRFRALTDAQILAYIQTGEPMDKAGAYGIQGGAGIFVEALDGSYENVMGFPVEDVESMLVRFTTAREGT